MKLKLKKHPPEDSTSALQMIPDADWNEEIAEDLGSEDLSELVVYSRDWTIETINNQIAKETSISSQRSSVEMLGTMTAEAN